MQHWQIGDNVLDTRDLENRINELEALENDYLDADDRRELKALREFRDEVQGYCDWLHGDTLVEEGFFPAYAEQLSEDIGLTKRHESWPNNFIDWEAAAAALKQDYTHADLDGFTYYVRMN